MPYEDWGQKLQACFSNEPITLTRWNEIKQSLAVGQEVVGIVVAKAPFAAWIDLGVGVPAILLLPDIAGLTHAKYALDDWCSEGTEVRASIVRFADDRQQIVLSQVGRVG